MTSWTAAHQASLSFTISWSLLKLMPTELVMPSKHLILCHPLLLLPSIFPSIRVFSNESTLHIRWPKYWNISFNIIPSNEYLRLRTVRGCVLSCFSSVWLSVILLTVACQAPLSLGFTRKECSQSQLPGCLYLCIMQPCLKMRTQIQEKDIIASDSSLEGFNSPWRKDGRERNGNPRKTLLSKKERLVGT